MRRWGRGRAGGSGTGAVAGQPEPLRPDGVRRRCSQCGAEVWVTPKNLIIGRLGCYRCCEAAAAACPAPVVVVSAALIRPEDAPHDPA